MPAPNSLFDYLDQLSPARQAAFTRLVSATASIPVPPSNASFVFRAGETDHPVFDDAELVFWKAMQQVHLREAASDGELPLVYWGFHSIDLLARRNSNGILVTDRTVYLTDVGRTSARFSIDELGPASIRVAEDRLEVSGSGVGLDQIEGILEPNSAQDAAAYLSEIVAAARVAAQNATRAAVAAAEDEPGASLETVEDLVLASRLSADFLIPSRPKNAKSLAKLASKWKLPPQETLLVSLSSATLAGIYGIAITDAAVYSRDLMEPLNRTPLADVEGFAWDAAAKGFRVSNDHLAPTHPAVTDENRAYVETLFANLIRAAAAHRA
jgi:hypothetical protein